MRIIALILSLVSAVGHASYLPGTSNISTPTPVAITNVSAVGTAQCQYIQIGSIVNVSCRVPLTCTTAVSTSTTIDVPLPIASNLSTSGDLNGGVYQNTQLGDAGGVCIEDNTNDRASCTFNCGSTTSLAGRRIVFQYVVK